MDIHGKKIILASNSPRRRELLAALGIDFTVDTGTSFVEEYAPDTPHTKVPELMSLGKSLGFHRELEPDEILVTSDTMVLCGTEILGKPGKFVFYPCIALWKAANNNFSGAKLRGMKKYHNT